MSEYKWKPFTLLVSAEEVKGNEMKIEAGKYYKTRDGRKVGPMRERGIRKKRYIEEKYDGRIWDDLGSPYGENNTQDDDIISEWQDEPSPIRTVTRREIVAGNYGSIVVDEVFFDSIRYIIHEDANGTAEELREAAHLLNQIAEVLEDNGK